MRCRACTASCYQMAVTAIVAGERYSLVCFCWACSVHRLVAGSCSYSWYWPRTYCIVIASTGPGPRVVGSSSQQRQLITYHVEFTEEEHPQPAPSPEHSLAYRRPTGGGSPVSSGPTSGGKRGRALLAPFAGIDSCSSSTEHSNAIPLLYPAAPLPASCYFYCCSW